MAKKTFETAIDQLNDIIKNLDSDELDIENALKKFEQGVQLVRFCSEKLDEAEKKVTVLIKDNNGVFTEKPFLDGI